MVDSLPCRECLAGRSFMCTEVINVFETLGAACCDGAYVKTQLSFDIASNDILRYYYTSLEVCRRMLTLLS